MLWCHLTRWCHQLKRKNSWPVLDQSFRDQCFMDNTADIKAQLLNESSFCKLWPSEHTADSDTVHFTYCPSCPFLYCLQQHEMYRERPQLLVISIVLLFFSSLFSLQFSCDFANILLYMCMYLWLRLWYFWFTKFSSFFFFKIHYCIYVCRTFTQKLESRQECWTFVSIDWTLKWCITCRSTFICIWHEVTCHFTEETHFNFQRTFLKNYSPCIVGLQGQHALSVWPV